MWIIFTFYNIIIKSANVDNGEGAKRLIHKMWIKRFFFNPPLRTLATTIQYQMYGLVCEGRPFSKLYRGKVLRQENSVYTGSPKFKTTLLNQY